jgi:hypothetical protein
MIIAPNEAVEMARLSKAAGHYLSLSTWCAIASLFCCAASSSASNAMRLKAAPFVRDMPPSGFRQGWRRELILHRTYREHFSEKSPTWIYRTSIGLAGLLLVVSIPLGAAGALYMYREISVPMRSMGPTSAPALPIL